MYKILSIDGGGIRGVIPAVVLAKIEQEIAKPLHEAFDLIVGTSTGGIIAVGLTAPASNRSGAAFSAQDVVEFYSNHGKDIFERSFWDGLTNPSGIVDELYSAANLENLLKGFI